MEWKSWISKIRRRRTIEVMPGGQWFLAITILFGVATVLSGNSVLYLLESLLLGFLVLSGILSDRMLYHLSVHWHENPVHAGGPVRDRITVRNSSRIPALAIELGEWTDQGFELRGYLPWIGGRTSRDVEILPPSYSRRGRHDWVGRVLTTRFPFGFARKIRWVSEEGERWVRPRVDPRWWVDPAASESPITHPASSSEFQEGAVRAHITGDDPREIAWIYSSSLLGPHLQRVRSQSPETVRLVLQPRHSGSEELETYLSELATEMLRAEHEGAGVELEVPSAGTRRGTRILEGDLAWDVLARYPDVRA